MVTYKPLVALILGVAVAVDVASMLADPLPPPLQQITARHVAAAPAEFKGFAALRVSDDAGGNNEDKLVILDGQRFKNGSIDLWLAGQPGGNSAGAARGFVGIAFRVAADASSFECIYLRPTNGRADDQERRNHASQYISFPAHPWHKLREASPSKYEAYVDLQPGEWTRVRVVVQGERAQLFVHDQPQPTLIVNDLKLGEREGGVALWIGPGTEAYFRDVNISVPPG